MPSVSPSAAGKLQFQPKVFDIDTSVCMSCQICVEVCPFDAIKMDVEYELSTGDRFGGLLMQKQQLAKPNRSTTRFTPPGHRRWTRASALNQPALKRKPKPQLGIHQRSTGVRHLWSLYPPWRI